MADPIIIKPIDLKPLKNYQGSLLFNNDCCAPLFPKESPTPTPTPTSTSVDDKPTSCLGELRDGSSPPFPPGKEELLYILDLPSRTDPNQRISIAYTPVFAYVGLNLPLKEKVLFTHNKYILIIGNPPTPNSPNLDPDFAKRIILTGNGVTIDTSGASLVAGTNYYVGQVKVTVSATANGTITFETINNNSPTFTLHHTETGCRSWLDTTPTPTPTIIPPTPEPSASRPVATPTPTPTSTSLESCKLNTWSYSVSTTIEDLSIEGLVSGACRVSSGAATITPTPEEHWYLINDPNLDHPYIESYQIFEPAASIALGKTSLWSGQAVNRTLFTQGEQVYINEPLDSRYSGYYYITNIENIVPDSARFNITRTRISLSCTRTSSCIGLEDSSPDLYLLDNIEPELVIATTEDGKTFKKKHSFGIERVQFGPGIYRFICGYTIDRTDLNNVISSQNNNSGILTVNTDYAKKIRAIIAPDGPTNLITVDTSEATEVDSSGYFVGLITVTVPQASALPDDPNKSIFMILETIDNNSSIDRIFYDSSCPNQLHPTATPTPTSSGPAPSPTPTPSFTPTVTPTLTSTPNPTPTTSSADPLTRAWDFSKTLIWGIEGTENEHGAGGTIRRAPEYDTSGGGNNSREASKNLYLIGADRADDNKGYGTYPAAEWYSTTWITAKDDQGGNMQYKFNKFYVGQRVNIYYPGGPAHPTLGVRGTNKNIYHNLSGRRGQTTRPNIIDQELSTLTVRKFERLRAEDPTNLTNEDVIRVWFYRTPPEPPTPEFGEGIVVKFETNADDHVNGLDPNFYVKLTSNTPITNNNFLGYVRRGDYDNTFLHRSIADFIIQGGLAKIPTGDSDQSDGNPVLIPQQASIRNEPYNKNLIGTIGMSKIAAKPDSATSQFFFNLKNNPHLDSDSSGYTVFGNVLSSDNNNTIGDGMTLINLLGSRLTYDASGFYADFSERSQLIELPFWFNNTPPGNIVIPSHFLQIKKVTIIQE